MTEDDCGTAASAIFVMKALTVDRNVWHSSS